MLNTQELQQSDSTHYLHPFTDAKSLKKKGARVITGPKESISGIPMATVSWMEWQDCGV